MPTEVKQTPSSERTALTISLADIPGLTKLVFIGSHPFLGAEGRYFRNIPRDLQHLVLAVLFSEHGYERVHVLFDKTGRKIPLNKEGCLIMLKSNG